MKLLPFEEVIQDASGGNAKVQKGDYLAAGVYPIVDQGQDFIGGFSNDQNDLVKGGGPWIVFGDHTRALKFIETPFCMGADGVKVLRLKQEGAADLKYIFRFLQHSNIPSAGYSRHYKFLKRLEIPLPPLDEQKRIAAILDKADALRAKRRQAIALLDSLTQSIFLEMFGDPVSNPKGWEVSPLSENADFISGGTPSKSSPSYWTGLIPWVSPKDMKSVVIADAIDHISESAVQQSAVKLVPEDTILIVVRGMILAHSVPIAILSRPAAFNQDIKGVRFHSHVEPHYGLWNLLSLRSHILKEVASAAHGTKRIDMDIISKLPVLRAPVSMQKAFKERCEHIIRNIGLMREAETKTAENFENLQSALFSSGAIE